MANIHHPVYEVGQKKFKHVDLAAIQELIDNTRMGIQINNTDFDEDPMTTKENEFKSDDFLMGVQQTTADVMPINDTALKNNSSTLSILNINNNTGKRINS